MVRALVLWAKGRGFKSLIEQLIFLWFSFDFPLFSLYFSFVFHLLWKINIHVPLVMFLWLCSFGYVPLVMFLCASRGDWGFYFSSQMIPASEMPESSRCSGVKPTREIPCGDFGKKKLEMFPRLFGRRTHGVHWSYLRNNRSQGCPAEFAFASLSLVLLAGFNCETHVGMLFLLLIAFVLFYFLFSSSFYLFKMG